MTNDKPWAYAVDRVGDVCTVRVSGDLDLDAREELQNALVDEITRPDVCSVQVDLSEIGFLGSAGISSLVAAYLAAQEANREFVVVRPTDTARRVLEITGVFPLLGSSRDIA